MIGMALPSDPFILLSVVNTKLRDEYSSLERLCDDLSENQAELVSKLEQLGYSYSAERNQFI